MYISFFNIITLYNILFSCKNFKDVFSLGGTLKGFFSTLCLSWINSTTPVRYDNSCEIRHTLYRETIFFTEIVMIFDENYLKVLI